LLCLPSYREGFGTVVVEAAAMSVPAIGSNTVGLVDAIEDGVTGLLVKPKDVNDLKAGLDKLILNQQEVIKIGEQAYICCGKFFDSKKISELVISEYLSLFGKEM